MKKGAKHNSNNFHEQEEDEYKKESNRRNADVRGI